MSFLEYLDEFRRRAVNSVIIVVIAFMLCWFVSDKIRPIFFPPDSPALSEANRASFAKGLTGNVVVINTLSGRVIRIDIAFDRATTLGIGGRRW